MADQPVSQDDAAPTASTSTTTRDQGTQTFQAEKMSFGFLDNPAPEPEDKPTSSRQGPKDDEPAKDSMPNSPSHGGQSELASPEEVANDVSTMLRMKSIWKRGDRLKIPVYQQFARGYELTLLGGAEVVATYVGPTSDIGPETEWELRTVGLEGLYSLQPDDPCS